jgi:hypothetical protein
MRDTIRKAVDHDPHFRWRGESVTRIENLSDIVFAIALGMLVSASSPPTTYSGLMAHLVTIIPVAAGFAIFVLIWNAHFTFFRRFGLADGTIVFLNGALLLFVLFIAYPLRFAFDALFGVGLGTFTGDWTRLADAGMDLGNASKVVGWFGIGQAIIFLILSMMYRHALHRTEALDLSSQEIVLTKRTLWHHRGDIVLSLLTAGLAFLSPLGPYAGFVLFLSWPMAAFIRWRIKLPGEATP